MALILDAERFPLGTKTLRVYLRNYDNRYFIVRSALTLAYWNGEDWQTLSLDPSVPVLEGEQTLGLAYPNEKQGYSQGYLSLNLTQYDFSFCEGKYRITQTVGDTVCTAYFELYE